MTRWWLEQPGVTRLVVVLGLLVALLACQRMWPARGEASPSGRHLRNIGLALIASAIGYVILPFTAVVLALKVEALGFGLLSAVHCPAGIEYALAIVLLDMAIYWQHRWSHQVPLLWRIHRVHHSDTHFDVTLGLRFHPWEILLSAFYKYAIILALGPAPVAVASYEILLVAFSLFTHADVAIPPAWNRWLRRIVVTPDWHRVHHSVHPNEADSNYGNFLTLWDRIFASRIDQPRDGHCGMQIGLAQFRNPEAQTLPALLRQPMANPPLQPTGSRHHA